MSGPQLPELPEKPSDGFYRLSVSDRVFITEQEIECKRLRAEYIRLYEEKQRLDEERKQAELQEKMKQLKVSSDDKKTDKSN